MNPTLDIAFFFFDHVIGTFSKQIPAEPRDIFPGFSRDRIS